MHFSASPNRHATHLVIESSSGQSPEPRPPCARHPTPRAPRSARVVQGSSATNASDERCRRSKSHRLATRIPSVAPKNSMSDSRRVHPSSTWASCSRPSRTAFRAMRHTWGVRTRRRTPPRGPVPPEQQGARCDRREAGPRIHSGHSQAIARAPLLTPIPSTVPRTPPCPRRVVVCRPRRRAVVSPRT